LGKQVAGKNKKSYTLPLLQKDFLLPGALLFCEKPHELMKISYQWGLPRSILLYLCLAIIVLKKSVLQTTCKTTDPLA